MTYCQQQECEERRWTEEQEAIQRENDYANASIKADQAEGWVPYRPEQDRTPDGRAFTYGQVKEPNAQDIKTIEKRSRK